MNTCNWRQLTFTLVALVAGLPLSATDGAPKQAVEFSTEVYAPTRPDRQLWALHQSIMYNQLFQAKLDYTIGYGLLVIGMAGSAIDQYAAAAVPYSGLWTTGAGPQFMFRGESIRVGPIGANFEFLGAVVVHGPTLPPAGSFYDFVWKVGLGFTIQGEYLRWHFGCRWYHMSNGQGTGPQNPSAEGIGLNVGFEWIPDQPATIPAAPIP